MPDKILIIEDEERIARFVELELVHEGYEAEKCGDGRRGLELALTGGFSLVLLDIMLPGLSGLEVMRRLRRESDVPVIMLTARDAVTDKVSGLDMGADDYVTKPFAIEELLARIRVVLRKRAGGAGGEPPLRCGGLTLDPARRSAEFRGEPIELTKREFDMLELMMRNEGVVISRDTFLSKVWGYDYAGETNTVDVYIRYLRGKIDDAFGVNLIRTVRGVGYALKGESDG